MVLHTANKHVAYPKLNINGNNIERVTNFNFFGLTLSSTLSWNQHINEISLNISKSIGILYRLRDIYPHAVLGNLYNALITPLIIVFYVGVPLSKRTIPCIFFRRGH